MLNINSKEYKILSNEIRYINSTVNKAKGYALLVEITFVNNGIKGYINFCVDFFNIKDFKNIENKTYIELPTDLDTKIDMIEIYDTECFIDFIDSEVKIVFCNIVENEIETEIYIYDEYIKLKYIGNLQLNYNEDK